MQREHATSVVADSMARPSDPFLHGHATGAERLTAGDDVYWLARRPNADHVERAWQSGVSAAGVMGVLTARHLPLGDATEAELSAVAAAASHILLSAYDHPRRPIVFKRQTD